MTTRRRGGGKGAGFDAFRENEGKSGSKAPAVSEAPPMQESKDYVKEVVDAVAYVHGIFRDRKNSTMPHSAKYSFGEVINYDEYAKYRFDASQRKPRKAGTYILHPSEKNRESDYARLYGHFPPSGVQTYKDVLKVMQPFRTARGSVRDLAYLWQNASELKKFFKKPSGTIVQALAFPGMLVCNKNDEWCVPVISYYYLDDRLEIDAVPLEWALPGDIKFVFTRNVQSA